MPLTGAPTNNKPLAWDDLCDHDDMAGVLNWVPGCMNLHSHGTNSSTSHWIGTLPKRFREKRVEDGVDAGVAVRQDLRDDLEADGGRRGVVPPHCSQHLIDGSFDPMLLSRLESRPQPFYTNKKFDARLF